MKNEIKIFSLFEQIEKENRHSIKIHLLNQALDTDEFIFKTIMSFVFNPNIKFYVSEQTIKQIKYGTKYNTNFNEFVSLCNLLSSGKYQGNNKLIILQNFFKRCDGFTFKWYSRILMKNIRIGVGINIINNVIKLEHKILPSPMLSTHINNIPESIKTQLFNNSKFICEIKIDGIRCLTHIIPNTTFYMYSRNGHRMKYLENVFAQYINTIVENATEEVILDGELFGGEWSISMGFSPTRQYDLPNNIKQKIKLFLFDYIPIKDNIYNIGRSQKYQINVPLFKRKEKLIKLLSKSNIKINKPNNLKDIFKINNNKIINVPIFVIDNSILNTKKIFDLCDLSIKLGWEGLMIKEIKSPYIFNYRSNKWIKIKKFETIDLLCIGINPSNKRKNEIASVTVLYNNQPVKIFGFTDEQKKLFYKHPELIINKIIEIKYFPILTGEKNKLRHATFIRIRNDL